MSDNSAIEWTDATWNPVTGCTKVSPGCDNCYAETFSERFRGVPGHHFENGFDVQLRPERLNQPIRWSRPRRIFVNSMSDLFHEKIPDEYIARVFGVMAAAPQHTFQVLTKRHGRMRSLVGRESFREQVFLANNLDQGDVLGDRWPLPNVWLGVSVEDQKRADLRVPALLETPAAVRFLSCEPLLGPVDLTEIAPGTVYSNRGFNGLVTKTRLDWVIVGGESGHGSRPMHPDWVRSIRDQCQSADVAFHFKQHGSHAPVTGEPRRSDLWLCADGSTLPWEPIDRIERRDSGELRNLPYQSTVLVRRMDKHAAGRDLDGRTWDEFPPETSQATP